MKQLQQQQGISEEKVMIDFANPRKICKHFFTECARITETHTAQPELSLFIEQQISPFVSG